jgi:hypothetical protein
MDEHFAGNPVSQMPGIACSRFGEPETLFELANDGFHMLAYALQQAQKPSRSRLFHVLE